MVDWVNAIFFKPRGLYVLRDSQIDLLLASIALFIDNLKVCDISRLDLSLFYF